MVFIEEYDIKNFLIEEADDARLTLYSNFTIGFTYWNT